MDSQVYESSRGGGLCKDKFAELNRRSNKGEFFGDRVLTSLVRELRVDPFWGTGLWGVRSSARINLGAKNRNFFRSFYANFDGIAIDSGDLNVNKITDDDAFVDLSR